MRVNGFPYPPSYWQVCFHNHHQCPSHSFSKITFFACQVFSLLELWLPVCSNSFNHVEHMSPNDVGLPRKSTHIVEMLSSSASSSPSPMMIHDWMIIILTGYGFPIASILLPSMDPDLSTCCRRQPHKNYIWENNRKENKTKSKKRKDADRNNNNYI